MSMTYENLQSLESEKKSQGIRNGLPVPQVFLQHLCSGPRLLLLSLGLSLLLLVSICVVGSKSGRLQETITSLKAEVENHRQQLQAARSLNDKVFSLESKLEKEQQELKAGYSDMVVRVQELARDLNSLSCQMAVLKSNGSQHMGCPVNWLEHECSCYWFSSTRKLWPEAEKYCQLENSHLVVIGSWEEQEFLEQRTYPMDTWMGLHDQDGPWTWVDGTDYEKGFQFWSPHQPDNWNGHDTGGDEDCAHITGCGRWNDNMCTWSFRWVCEKKLGRAS
ncbi:asialoglycoprotein receptor 1-like [Glossophaga mutica]